MNGLLLLRGVTVLPLVSSARHKTVRVQTFADGLGFENVRGLCRYNDWYAGYYSWYNDFYAGYYGWYNDFYAGYYSWYNSWYAGYYSWFVLGIFRGTCMLGWAAQVPTTASCFSRLAVLCTFDAGTPIGIRGTTTCALLLAADSSSSAALLLLLSSSSSLLLLSLLLLPVVTIGPAAPSAHRTTRSFAATTVCAFAAGVHMRRTYGWWYYDWYVVHVTTVARAHTSPRCSRPCWLHELLPHVVVPLMFDGGYHDCVKQH